MKLSGFRNFQLRDKPQRPGRNPKTEEEIAITARRVVTFYRVQVAGGSNPLAPTSQIKGFRKELFFYFCTRSLIVALRPYRLNSGNKRPVRVQYLKEAP